MATLALLAARPAIGEANHASVSSHTQAVAFLVNGYGGCCIPASVGTWLGSLKDDTGAPIVQVHESNWNHIDQGGNPGAFPFGGLPDPVTDDGFVEDMRQAVEELDAQHSGLELIIVGHSFGGDAVLEVAKAIRPRRIAMLAVLDPVGRAGLRTNVTYPVPGNVEYLYNRWQTNAPYPLDFFRPGRLPSSARESDQDAQSIRRDSRCRIKYVDQLHVFPELMLHAQMPKDSCVQAQLKRILLSRVFNPNPRVSGGAIVPGGVIVEGVRVAFNEAIDSATFTLDDIVSASGTPTGIEPLSGTGSREFIVRLTPVAVPPRARPLRLVVGPSILDVDGNPMDQDLDLVPGEAVQDRYTFEYGQGGVQPPIKLPRVVALKSILGLEGRIEQIVALELTFNRALDRAIATDLGSYRLVSPGADDRLGTADDRAVALVSAAYNPQRRVLRLTPRISLSPQRTFQIVVEGSGLVAFRARLGGARAGELRPP
jgi:pimeloyl-ACP methyl ester carboxylesterase